MKYDAMMIIAVLRYWLKNGKTMTALIVGFVTLALKQLGFDELSPDAMELSTEFVTFLIAAGGGLVVGVVDKIRKLVNKKEAAIEGTAEAVEE